MCRWDIETLVIWAGTYFLASILNGCKFRFSHIIYVFFDNSDIIRYESLSVLYQKL